MRVLFGWERIRDERLRQISEEGWTPDHDAEHEEGELILAAKCYLHISDVENAAFVYRNPPATRVWPWSNSWWKPSSDPICNLEKAGALIAAEIDRLTRNG